MISMITAMGNNRVIGKDGHLPWSMPAEYGYYLRMIEGHPVIVGRKNFEAQGGAYPNRRNIIVTRDHSYQAEGATVVHSAAEALALFEGSAEEVFIIGGGEIYSLFLPFADVIYLTIIDFAFEGDITFPVLEELEWREVMVRPGMTDEHNPYRYHYHLLKRINK